MDPFLKAISMAHNPRIFQFWQSYCIYLKGGDMFRKKKIRSIETSELKFVLETHIDECVNLFILSLEAPGGNAEICWIQWPEGEEW